MADGESSLGKATLDLQVSMDRFLADMKTGRGQADQMQNSLDALAAVSKIAEDALKQVKMTPGQAGESDTSAASILEGVRGVSDEAKAAALELDRVKLTAAQAAETRASADVQAESLKKVGRQAEETTAKIEVMNRTGRNGAGVGPFGSGFGRIGLLGAGVGAGVLTGPAAGPAIAGLAASIPVLASTGVGALGALALAFDGVGKAIGGDKKAFDALMPAQQSFVLSIRSLSGWLDKLKQTAGQDMFPGLTAGLHGALSPGTIGAVTKAVAEFATAIGQAGKAWGQYFGSAEFQSIFGPLMAAGAKNLGVLSSAALHLFDALGVLARAAIPFTSWMTEGIAKGAQLADSWMHAKDASGALSGAMGEAETSLRLVGNLLGSLLKAVGALGSALYPVSKVAVKDLTDGLNALAGIIDRNKQTIRDIVGGALAAFVALVKNAAPVVRAFAGFLSDVASSVGGWKTAFEIILSGALLLKLGALVKGIAAMKLEVSALGLAIDGLPLAGIVIPIVLAITYRKQISDAISGATDSVLGALGVKQGSAITPAQAAQLAKTQPALAKQLLAQAQAGLGNGASGVSPAAEAAAKASHGLATAPPATSTYSASQLQALWIQAGGSASMAPLMAQIALSESSGRSGIVNSIGAAGLWQIYNGHQPTAAQRAQLTNPLDNAKAAVAKYNSQGLGAWDASKHAWSNTAAYQQYLATQGGSTSPWGSQPPWTSNTGQPTAKQAAATAAAKAKAAASAAARALSQKLQIPVTNDQTLVAHFKSLAAAATTGPMIEKYLDDEIASLKKEDEALAASMQGKSALQKAKIKGQIQKNEDLISKLHAQVVQAIGMAADSSAFQKFQSKLAGLTSKFNADSDYAAVLTGDAAAKYSAVLQGDLTSQATVLQREAASLKTKLAADTGKRKAQIQAELGQVTSQLQAVQQQILQSLQGNVQTLQSKVAGYFQSVTASFDAQFEAQTQALLDAAGLSDFQNGAQTPLEAQLAQMQAADQLQSLQDAVAQATDAQTKAAAQRQLDEYNLGIQAAAQRAAADQDYAAQVKKIQADRTAAENEMNAKLTSLSDAFQNGTGTIGDLNDIATLYGITVGDGNIPDFQNLSTATQGLHQAFADLANYIANMTGNAPRVAGPSGGDAAAAIAALVAHGGVAGNIGGAGGAIFPGGGLPPAFGHIPELDTGGHVLQTGLAVVHRGETYSGVGRYRQAGGVTIQTGPVYGAVDQATARRWAAPLKTAIEQVVQR